MKFWKENVDRMLEYNDKPLLQGKGSISNKMMEEKVREIYEIFDKSRISRFDTCVQVWL